MPWNILSLMVEPSSASDDSSKNRSANRVTETLTIPDVFPLAMSVADSQSAKTVNSVPLARRNLPAPALAASVKTESKTKESISTAILTAGELEQIQDLVTQTRVGDNVQRYLVALATASRNHPDIDAGLSPRGLLLWQRAAQATAHLAGRDFVTPDDVQQVAFPVLAVRLDVEAADSRNLISQLLESVEVPTEPT